MSGHSKWSTIKHHKSIADAKRAANFTKLAREIQVAARGKGSDPAMNFRLRLAIDRARAGNMPKDNIERAIARGAGIGVENQMDELRYEAYAPGGSALIIECITDNRNRAANEVKLVLSKNGGTLASAGSVTYLFNQKGLIRTDLIPFTVRDEIELALIEAGSEDIFDQDQETLITCAITDLSRVSEAAVANQLHVKSVSIDWLPKTTVELDDTNAESLAKIIDALEELDDVSNVYTNAG